MLARYTTKKEKIDHACMCVTSMEKTSSLTNQTKVSRYINQECCRPVFFNLFAAAEPHTSVKITHRTPCDVCEVEATGCLPMDSFP